ncbi:MAG: VOC family protein [Bacteroidota bacterium]
MKINTTILELMVNSVEETVAFYQDMLDFQLIASDEEEGKIYWAMMQLGEFKLSFKNEDKHKAEAPFLKDETIGGSVVLCFHVDDINTTYDLIKAKCDTLDHPHITPCGAIDFSMRDINGYVLTFEQLIKD